MFLACRNIYPCLKAPGYEKEEADDLTWQGVAAGQTGSCLKQEDIPVIRKPDLENHNKDGGLWIVVNGKVYDVQDWKGQAPCGADTLQQFANQEWVKLSLINQQGYDNYSRNELPISCPFKY